MYSSGRFSVRPANVKGRKGGSVQALGTEEIKVALGEYLRRVNDAVELTAGLVGTGTELAYWERGGPVSDTSGSSAGFKSVADQCCV